MKKILICNGSLGQDSGNTQQVINEVINHLQTKNVHTEVLQLRNLLDKKESINEIKSKLENADGFIFTSGTYWDNWGSPLQYFLEEITQFEASVIFMGKPAAVIITMHSVGGKSVLSRLQGVLNTLGMLIPPMTGLVYSLANQLSLESESSFSDDFWSLEDIPTVLHNLLTSLGPSPSYKAWAVDHKDPKRIWIK